MKQLSMKGWILLILLAGCLVIIGTMAAVSEWNAFCRSLKISP